MCESVVFLFLSVCVCVCACGGKEAGGGGGRMCKVVPGYRFCCCCFWLLLAYNHSIDMCFKTNFESMCIDRVSLLF